MSDNGTKRFGETRARQADRVASAKPLVSFFTDQHAEITESRLQKLLFYADATYYRDHDERLTQIAWRPYMYGMYSDDIKDALDALEDDGLTTTMVLRNRRAVKAYVEPPAYSLDADVRRFLDSVHRETEEISLEELSQWSKDHPLNQVTEFGDVVDFTAVYWEQYRNEEVRR